MVSRSTRPNANVSAQEIKEEIQLVNRLASSRHGGSSSAAHHAVVAVGPMDPLMMQTAAAGPMGQLMMQTAAAAGPMDPM